MHILRGLRREQAAQCLPELRRRLCAAADPADTTVAAERVRHHAASLGQARASEFQSRGYRCTFGGDQGYSTAGTLSRRRNRALDLAKADAVTLALAPAMEAEGIAVLKKGPLDTGRQFQRLGAVPGDLQQAAALIPFGA